MNLKKVIAQGLIVIAAFGTVYVGVTRWNNVVNFYERQAHATATKIELKKSIDEVAGAFKNFSVRQEKRGVKREVRDFKDKYGLPNLPFDEMMIPEGEERDRYRELLDELEELNAELKTGG